MTTNIAPYLMMNLTISSMLTHFRLFLCSLLLLMWRGSSSNKQGLGNPWNTITTIKLVLKLSESSDQVFEIFSKSDHRLLLLCWDLLSTTALLRSFSFSFLRLLVYSILFCLCRYTSVHFFRFWLIMLFQLNGVWSTLIVEVIFLNYLSSIISCFCFCFIHQCIWSIFN